MRLLPKIKSMISYSGYILCQPATRRVWYFDTAWSEVHSITVPLRSTVALTAKVEVKLAIKSPLGFTTSVSVAVKFPSTLGVF